jgi:hypothetical protein
MKLAKGQHIPVDPNRITYDMSMDRAMTDIYDALVELITNADDSYGRLYRKGLIKKDGGKILVRRFERRGQPSYIVVQDRAEGMTLERMVQVLREPGIRTASRGDRGAMGRGAKDCSKFGDMLFESIVNGRLYACQLTRYAQEVVIQTNPKGTTATNEDRRKLGVRKGQNGTSVTLFLDDQTLPHLEHLEERLRSHFALRDIVAKHTPGRLLLIEGSSRNQAREVTYYPPEAESICIEEAYALPGYPHVEAYLTIYRLGEPLEPAGNRRFRQDGILVKGARAIHDCSFLRRELERDEHRRRYFGRIRCEHIDKLAEQWREYHEKRQLKDLPARNPKFIVDPERRFGLNPDHPFTEQLFQYPSEQLRALFAKDREREKKTRREIGNQQTRKRLTRLARLASRFMAEQVDDLEATTDKDSLERSGFGDSGLLIVPSGASVAVGEEQRFYLYVKRALLKEDSASFRVSASNEKIQVLGEAFSLGADDRRHDRLRGVFRVKGIGVTPAAKLTVSCPPLESRDLEVEVVETAIDDRPFADPVEFERQEYGVRVGGRRSLRLFAKYPQVVSDRTTVRPYSSADKKVVIRGQCVLTPVAGTNFAEGQIPVEGRTLGCKATVTAEVNGRRAEAIVNVIQERKNGEMPIEIKLVDEDFLYSRSKWRDDQGKPYLLHINGRHESLRRYLGEPVGDPPQFPGENSPLYLVLLAEIVAEAVCHRTMLEQAKKSATEFADLVTTNDPREILDTARAMYTRRFKDFIVRAHKEMVKHSELKPFLAHQI